LVSHRRECGDVGTGAGIYSGPGCIDPFNPGPWLDSKRNRKGLHVALQAKYLPDGTSGINPTTFQRNSYLENQVKDMYSALRDLLGIADDSVTNFQIGLNIYK
jgi:hypothetical protein